jgi:hypothetical protein
MTYRVLAFKNFALDEKQASTAQVCLLVLDFLPNLPRTHLGRSF